MAINSENDFSSIFPRRPQPQALDDNGDVMLNIIVSDYSYPQLTDLLSNLEAKVEQMGKVSLNAEEFDQKMDAEGAVNYLQSIIRFLGNVKADDQVEYERIIQLAIWVGRLMERVNVWPHNHAATIGHDSISHAEMMRIKKAEKGEEERRKKRMQAEQALNEAEQNHPFAAAEGSLTILKGKAAESLEISYNTFDRWLKYSQ